ncbi:MULTISPECIES: PLD nuclease N-terminal domain-containing protein [Exiguobacterium]|uniref:PLD nuclease N-terminal domain-containing protein n=1 Tax=Exiguobacterium antarcticum TaxID=132920 RepID=A0ABT6R2W3_9BACL|nr:MULTISPECIES: PLD nuclease N-terminal domain-containing protein [Exiguobacterium]MCT4780679.1 PLD nuclease N-terminal domain-containing protein [Exiguobacterium soli]MDI3235168.1 PLD nuclease N-terminal domain-containing protein [Exiguobacterium antarcticum]
MRLKDSPYVKAIVYTLEFILLIASYVDLWNRPRTRGPKWVWGILIFVINYLGPIIYLIWGRHPSTDPSTSD